MLQPEEIRTLLQLVAQTRRDEIDCDECLTRVAALLDHAGVDPAASGEIDAQVAHHLSICTECEEEYRALAEVLGIPAPAK